MADTIGERCIKAIVTALDGAGKPADLAVHRFRSLPLHVDQLPALVVYALEQSAQRVGTRQGSVADKELVVGVECRVAADEPDVAIDPLLAWAIQSILADPKLGGVAMDVSETKTAWASALTEDQTYGAARVEFAVHYRSRAADPTIRV